LPERNDIVLKALTIAALLATVPAMVAAQPADPAASRIEAYNQAVIGVMKDGPKLGMKGRTARFQTIVHDHYAMGLIAQIVVGAKWTSLSQADRNTAISALAKHSAVSLASNFESFDGEKFTVVPQSQLRGADRLVSSSIAPRSGSPTTLIYRMRQSGGQWQIIDVISSGVSQLSLQRSDLAQSIATGGVAGLVKKLDEIDAKMLSAR
jgi:phospholipid transport system substrate-binding protein